MSLSEPFDRYVAPARERPGLWRLAVGLLVMLGVYAVVNMVLFVLAMLLLGPDAAESRLAQLATASSPTSALVLLATFVPMIAGVLLAARLLHGRGPGSLFGPRAVVVRDFATASGVLFGVFIVAFVLWSIGYDSVANLPASIWAMLLPLALLGIAVQTLAEELVFRAYLQQQLAARSSLRLVWMVLPSALFGLLHFDTEMMGAAAPVAVVGAMLFGLIAADLTARTGSIGAAWGAHFANNTVAIAILATEGTITGLALRVTPYAIDDLSVNPVLAILDLAPLLLLWLVLRWALGRRPAHER